MSDLAASLSSPDPSVARRRVPYIATIDHASADNCQKLVGED